MLFVTGKIDIQLSVDVPTDIELVEPLQESCIWRQARGAATEISGVNDPGSLDKVFLQMETFLSRLVMHLHSLPFLVQVGVAQQWYDELDDLAAPKPEPEMTEDNNLDINIVVDEDEKVRISSRVFTSPGTSEVCF